MEKRTTAWWIEGGTEVCDVCGHPHAYELEYRCYDCDAPICPVCVVTVRRAGHAFCPGCVPREQED